MTTATFFSGTGRRKTAVARVRLMAGEGEIVVNGRTLEQHFGNAVPEGDIRLPFRVTGTEGRFNAMVKVEGGGVTGQAGAIRHGIARALLSRRPGREPRASAPGRAPDPRSAHEGAQEVRPQAGPQGAAVHEALIVRAPRPGCPSRIWTRAGRGRVDEPSGLRAVQGGAPGGPRSGPARRARARQSPRTGRRSSSPPIARCRGRPWAGSSSGPAIPGRPSRFSRTPWSWVANDDGATLGRAKSLAALGRPADAAATYDRLAEIRRGGERLADACEALRRALEIEPTPARRKRYHELARELRLSAGDAEAERALGRALRLLEQSVGLESVGVGDEVAAAPASGHGGPAADAARATASEAAEAPGDRIGTPETAPPEAAPREPCPHPTARPSSARPRRPGSAATRRPPWRRRWQRPATHRAVGHVPGGPRRLPAGRSSSPGRRRPASPSRRDPGRARLGLDGGRHLPAPRAPRRPGRRRRGGRADPGCRGSGSPGRRPASGGGLSVGRRGRPSRRLDRPVEGPGERCYTRRDDAGAPRDRSSARSGWPRSSTSGSPPSSSTGSSA